MYHSSFRRLKVDLRGWFLRGSDEDSQHPRRSNPLFLVRRVDLLNQGVNFFRGQFRRVPGHSSLTIIDDGTQFIGGFGTSIFREERRSAEVAAFRGFAMTLRAIFFVDRVGG